MIGISKFRDSLLGVTVALCSSCVSYSPEHAIRHDAEPPGWTESRPAAIAAVATVNSNQQRAVFDADLSTAGVVPVHVRIRNNSGRAMLIRRDQAALRLPDGVVLSPVDAQRVAAMAGRSGADKAVSGYTSPPPVSSAPAYYGAYTAVQSAGAVALLSAGEAERARSVHYRQMELQDSVFTSERTLEGFVYFLRADRSRVFSSAILRVPVEIMDNGETHWLEAPVSSSPQNR